MGGKKYMFVSNSDNLGATMDLKILTYFVESKAPFMMEVAQRTEADKKGGHLAKSLKTGGLLLRESAQCPEEDEKAFQDTSKYTYFNTNNLWINLEALREIFKENNGAIPLPVMKNSKTVDPRNKKSTKVIQLETAMGRQLSVSREPLHCKSHGHVLLRSRRQVTSWLCAPTPTNSQRTSVLYSHQQGQVCHQTSSWMVCTNLWMPWKPSHQREQCPRSSIAKVLWWKVKWSLPLQSL